jgi:hypothetical protein
MSEKLEQKNETQTPRKVVIEKEAAMAIMKNWCDYFAEPLEDAELENTSLLKAVMQGRVEFIEETETFRLSLRTPILLANKETISLMDIHDPGATYALDKQKAISKNKALEFDMDIAATQATCATEQPIGILRRLSMHDYSTIDNLLSFFR